MNCDRCGDPITPSIGDDNGQGFQVSCDTCKKPLRLCEDCWDNSDDCPECEDRRDEEQRCVLCDMPLVNMTPEVQQRHRDSHK